MNNAQALRRPDPERDPIQLEAADWVGRLSNSTVSVEETLSWQDWMKADARHAEAFFRLEQISCSLRMANPPPPPWKWQLQRDGYDGSMPISDWNLRRRGVFRNAIWVAAATSVAFTAAAMVWLVPGSGKPLWNHSQQIASTAIGVNRTVALADGSTVTLGGNTRLRWSFTDRERSLTLEHGEALFEVAQDAIRPFNVRAGDARVIALGTAFNVRRASDHTVVAVTDGRVVVEPVAHLLPIAVLRELKPKLQPVHLDTGEQTTARSTGIEKARRMKDVATATSWQTGRLSFRMQPLRYVLEDVNRYAKKPISAANDRVGSLVVSGTVLGNNTEGWVQSLEHAFGLVAIEEDSRIVLMEKSQRAPMQPD